MIISQTNNNHFFPKFIKFIRTFVEKTRDKKITPLYISTLYIIVNIEATQSNQIEIKRTPKYMTFYLRRKGVYLQIASYFT